jgi:hypothetical protein
MRTLVCSVCEHSNNRGMIRCGRCAWELHNPEFSDSLPGLEKASYLRRRDLVRARWREFHQYDQTPRRKSIPAETTKVQAAATTAKDLAIGGGLL